MSRIISILDVQEWVKEFSYIVQLEISEVLKTS